MFFICFESGNHTFLRYPSQFLFESKVLAGRIRFRWSGFGQKFLRISGSILRRGRPTNCFFRFQPFRQLR